MEQKPESTEPSESIFVLREVPGPVYALKQQGDRSRVPAKEADGQSDR